MYAAFVVVGIGCLLAVSWMAGCSAQIDAERSDSTSGADTAGFAADGGRTSAVATTSVDSRSVAYDAVETSLSDVAATRSAVSLPFGATDLFLGARNERGAVVVWPEPEDAPGALWEPLYIAERGDVSGRLLDMCLREEANAAVSGRVLEPGDPLGYEELIWVRDAQLGLGCDGEPRCGWVSVNANSSAPTGQNLSRCLRYMYPSQS